MTTELPMHPMRAAVAMVTAMALIGVIDNFIIRLADHIGLWQFHFTRALVALPLVALLAVAGLGRLLPRRPGRVALRSLLVAVSMLCYFGALGMMPIAQALAGLFTSPIFILLITAGFMQARIGPWRIVAVAIGFLGTLLVLQPDPANFRWITLLPVLGGLFYALGAIATRSLCEGESTVALLGGMMLALGVLGALGLVALWLFPAAVAPGAQDFLVRGWVWPMHAALPLVVMQAVGSVAGVFLIIKAYQLGEASYVAVFEYSVMGFGPLFAWIAFGQGVGAWQIAGIALIAVAGGIIAVRSR